jgi:hypothetical protein
MFRDLVASPNRRSVYMIPLVSGPSGVPCAKPVHRFSALGATCPFGRRPPSLVFQPSIASNLNVAFGSRLGKSRRKNANDLWSAPLWVDRIRLRF